MFLQIWDDIAIDYAKDPGRLERLKEAVRQLEESGEITDESEIQETDAIEKETNEICEEEPSVDVVESNINTVCEEEASADVVPPLPKPTIHPTKKPATSQVRHIHKMPVQKTCATNKSFACECSSKLPRQQVCMIKNEATFRQIAFSLAIQ